jgi:glycosyltransferase involved in cell wall biosynthesis
MATFALRVADLVTGDSADLEEAARRLAPATPFLRFVFGPPHALFDLVRQPNRIVLSTRRVEREMRVELAVAAFRHAMGSDPAMAHWRMVVAGDGRRAEVLRGSVAGDTSIELVGHLEASALLEQLARSAIFISVPESDATSVSLLEAMATGLVPVVNELPANLEWVDPSIGEIVSKDPSLEELGSAITRAANRRVDPDQIRAKVRGVTWEAEIDRLVSAYRRLP